MDRLLSREEITSLMSVRGKENIIHAVSQIDDGLLRQYLTMVLLIDDMRKEIDDKIRTNITISEV